MNKDKFIQELCYQNLPEDYHEELKELGNDLGFLERSIYQAISSMRVDKYACTWKEYKANRYRLIPIQKIIIPVYKNRIKIFEEFKERIPLMNSKWEKIDFELVEKSKKNNWFIVEVDERIKEDETIHYGPDEVRWEREQKDLTINKKTRFSDENNVELKPLEIKVEKNSYILLFDRNSEFKGKELYVDGRKLEFKKANNNYNFKKLWIYSKKNRQKTKFNVSFKRSQYNNEIESTEIKSNYGYVADENGNIFQFSLIPANKNKEEGVWIVLEDDLNEYEETDGRTKKDVFFSLIDAAFESEVWESSDRRDKKKIRVLKIDVEEGRLLLERKPGVKEIYPPENTYQLEMQKNAVITLLHRPSPEHLPLLKIFMDREKVFFNTPSRYYKKIDWAFLIDPSREGTLEQRDFVKKSLGTPDFALLEGPPGSGKTTAITELIYQLLMDGKKVMLAASTHVAVDNVLENIYEYFDGNPMENGVVPLRIGREAAMSDKVQAYQIEKRIKKVEPLFNDEEWFNALDDDKKREYLENAVVHSSNLVCGTTIGILQYPPFKKKRGKYFEPEFDYLIMDEASKTTLQEFLVPAVNAMKWIIVGDVKQLSPFTETLQIQLLIDDILEDSNMKTALNILFKIMFNRKGARIGGKWYHPPKFVSVAPKSVIESIAEIIKEKSDVMRKENLYAFVVSNDLRKKKRIFGAIERDSKVLSEMDIRKGENALPILLSREIIFAEDSVFYKYHGNFPWDHILIWHEQEPKHHPHNYRHLYWYRKMENGLRVPYALYIKREGTFTDYGHIQKEIKKLLKKGWAEELAWRLKRIQELEYENSEEGSKKDYWKEVSVLMPPKPEDINASKPYNKIKKIEQLWMPSILKSLQEGISGDWDDKKTKTSFSHGFPDDVKEERFSALTYQHRMHPDISKIPRELFYDNKALKDDEFVKKNGRKWGYNGYRKRVAWVDVPGPKNVIKNVNQVEGKIVLRELEKFIEWDSEQDKKHTAIILSFYEGQRKHIRDKLREKYPENRNKRTRFTIKGVDVRVYTVDKVQGKEGDIVFLSMVRNNSVGFMDSPNRINVALTRAKYQLVIVGNIRYFGEQKRSPSLRKFAKKVQKIGDVIGYGKKN